MKKKQTFADWWNEHKKEVLTGLVIGTAAVGGFLLLRKYMNVGNSANISVTNPHIALDKTPPPTPVTEIIYNQDVEVGIPGKISHIGIFPRKLPTGQKASPEKLALAQEFGICLQENETWVIDHDRHYAA